jgi:hypothetical protein
VLFGCQQASLLGPGNLQTGALTCGFAQTGGRSQVTKLIRSAAGVTGFTAVSLALFGSGIAAADDYAGQTYSDASGAIDKAGQKAVIAGSVGSVLAQTDCIVTRSQQADWLKGSNFSPVTDTVLLWLNCNAKLATAGTPQLAGESGGPRGEGRRGPEGGRGGRPAVDRAERLARSTAAPACGPRR